ncbi:DoxX family protein [Actinoplanes sp. LDG1-01]|uniref:DoxX family protein n=1 Tax=Paractinoplanes lichenicola TaxID=2802976 RepID=A0ABS1VF72_9ACTN|nr:DoxX family protein [Actinoplanes lichenicola]
MPGRPLRRRTLDVPARTGRARRPRAPDPPLTGIQRHRRSLSGVLAAVGLVLPAALDIVPVLVPLAAVGLVLLMAGAAIVHLRRGESKPIIVNLLFLALAATVAIGRSA